MGRTGQCAGIPPQLGVHVTGAIAPADRAALVRHLASCERCPDELAGLAAQPSGESAAAHERDAGEALLGRVLGRMAVRRRRRRRALAAAAAVLAAAAAAGWALRPGSPPSGPVASGTVLQTETIGGVTVLADAAGFTLHWFASDTAARSNCTGSCARRWPPVTGPATAGAGVTGAVGWVTRTDGSIQATYDGHRLYTGSVDTAAGQARGNGLTAPGGVRQQAGRDRHAIASPEPAAGHGPCPRRLAAPRSPAEPSGHGGRGRREARGRPRRWYTRPEQGGRSADAAGGGSGWMLGGDGCQAGRGPRGDAAGRGGHRGGGRVRRRGQRRQAVPARPGRPRAPCPA